MSRASSPLVPRPSRPVFRPEDLPGELKLLPQFVPWRYTWSGDKGKWDKPPRRLDGKMGSATDPRCWYSFDEALRAVREPKQDFDGIGLVLTSDDPYCGIDLDHCVHNGILEKWAQDIVDALSSYTEISPGGGGVRILVRATLSPSRGNRKGRFEIYNDRRYLTLTGNHVAGTPEQIADRQVEVDRIVARELPLRETRLAKSPSLAVAAPIDNDVDLLDRARAAKNGPAFAALYDRGDLASFAGDHSAADLALCGMLAFWTRGDSQRVDAAFRGSALFRAKWDEPHRSDGATYGQMTIETAVAECRAANRRSGDSNSPAASPGEPGVRGSQAKMLLQILASEGFEYFHDAAGSPFVSFERAGHLETWSTTSPTLKKYLCKRFYEETEAAIQQTSLTSAINVIEAEAVFRSGEILVALRCARENDTIYVDLCDPNWRVVRATSSGWELIPSQECPIRFQRYKGMLPLPEPVSGTTLASLDQYVRTDRRGLAMIKGFLVSAFCAGMPTPVLNLHGPQGSGKSTIARRIRSLLDPNSSPLRCEPHEKRDIAAAARNNFVCVFDNLSRIQDWLSDALCRLSTGGGIAARELYTNAEEHVVEAMRPTIVNSIDNVVVRGDLADRSLNVSLEVIDEGERLTEDELSARFERDRAKLLGAILTAVATALKRQGDVDRLNLARMADFDLFVRAAEPSLGLAPGEGWVSLYRESRLAGSRHVLDGSPLTERLCRLAEGQGWSGTWNELFDTIVPREESVRRAEGWPRSPRGLSSAVARLIPDLRVSLGVALTVSEKGRDRRRWVTIALVERGGTSATSATSAEADVLTHFVEDSGEIGTSARPTSAPPPLLGTSGEACSQVDSPSGSRIADVADVEPLAQSAEPEDWEVAI